MDRSTLGSQGLEVSALGLGCMGMTYAYSGADAQQSEETIRRALELGVTHLDTAEIYGPYTNEELVGRVIAGRRDEFEIATKFGFNVDPSFSGDRTIDARPENVRHAIEGSLRRLGTDHVDLYYQHRIDPEVPVEETIGAMSELVSAGKVRYIGISEATPETIRRAHATYPLTAVQTEYSLWTRDPEDEVLPTVRELGIGFVAYSPLGRGFLTGTIRSEDDLAEDDWRRGKPRFTGKALEENVRLADRVAEIAAAHDATAAQVAIAWVLAKGGDVVPIPGTTKPSRIEEDAAAVGIELSDEVIAELDEAVSPESVRGARYHDQGMAQVNL